ncbi:MAG: efflux RND transporter periplasmic adaptor subunit [Bacteroidota bacterium]
MKRKLIIIGSSLGILVFAFLLAGFFAGKKKEPEKKKPVAQRKVVQTKSVRYENIQTEIIAYGRVETAQSLALLSEVSGRMFQGKVRLKEGQRFRKGTLLFFIDDEEASLNLKSNKSNFLRDLAGILPDLKVDFNENYEAWQQYFNSLAIDEAFDDLPEVKSEKEKTFLATKGIFSSFYSIKSSEVKLSKYRYYAPFSGSITEINLQSGSFVNMGANIGTIIRSGAHELKVAIETKDIPWVQPSTPVKIFSEETQQYWMGEVTRISDFVNQNTQSVDIFITIESNGQRIYDGQFFQAAVPARTVTNGMIMPRSAIYNGNEVFVVEDDSLLKVKQVNVVRLMEEEAIFTGLEKGVDVVVEPLVGAYNNMRVEKREKKDIDLEIKTGEKKKLLNAEAAQSNLSSN